LTDLAGLGDAEKRAIQEEQGFLKENAAAMAHEACQSSRLYSPWLPQNTHQLLHEAAVREKNNATSLRSVVGKQVFRHIFTFQYTESN
jgi:hypothetical protein